MFCDMLISNILKEFSLANLFREAKQISFLDLEKARIFLPDKYYFFRTDTCKRVNLRTFLYGWLGHLKEYI